jgi:hypothetical protein
MLLLLYCGFAQQEVIGGNVKVIFDQAELENYALQVAHEAEEALEILEPYFGKPKSPITITINNNTDIYNGFASPLPRPKVSIRALFPNDGSLALSASSDLFLLLIHELTHVQQLAYNEQLHDPTLPQLGLVGQNVARIPPMWFLEGIATWIESEHTSGGRRDDAFTKSLLYTLVLSETFPTLDDISLETFDDWPEGQARYVLGVSFLDYLIDTHGFENILEVLKHFNMGFIYGFSISWQSVMGTSLFDEWETWKTKLEQEAKAIQTQDITLLTDTASFTSSPSFNPDGSRVAWVSMPSQIVVADFDGTEFQNQRTVIEKRFVDSLDWLDQSTLIYSRIVRQPGTEFLELFRLDINTGKETQLTTNARAQMPRALPDGCILFVRDLPYEGSRLRRFCDGVIDDYWSAPEGVHIVGLDTSLQGQIVMSLWQKGQVDIALLDKGQPRYVTQDVSQDLQPNFQDETQILFSSDRSGRFELYRIHQLENRIDIEPLTMTLGGAYQSTANADVVLYTTLGPEGYDIALLDQPVFTASAADLSTGNQQNEVTTSDETKKNTTPSTFQTRAYTSQPSMKPYGWIPSFGVSVSPLGAEAGMSIVSLDDTLQHNLAVNIAYDTTLKGHLYGATVFGRYGYRDNSVFSSLLPPYPVGYGVQLGVWEHTGHLDSVRETAMGIQGYVATTLPFDRWVLRARLELGLLHLPSFNAFQPDARLETSVSQLSLDDWSYRTRGQRFGVTSVYSASSKGGSFGVWADAVYYRPLPVLGLSGTLELALRTGYKQSPPISLALNDWAAVGLVGYRMSVPIEWHIDDGVYALERITLEPRLRPYVDGSIGLAGDLTVSADAVLGYGAPVSFSLSIGYAQGLWYGLGWRLPL